MTAAGLLIRCVECGAPWAATGRHADHHLAVAAWAELSAPRPDLRPADLVYVTEAAYRFLDDRGYEPLIADAPPIWAEADDLDAPAWWLTGRTRPGYRTPCRCE